VGGQPEAVPLRVLGFLWIFFFLVPYGGFCSTIIQGGLHHISGCVIVLLLETNET
jgi:hypothetical protein